MAKKTLRTKQSLRGKAAKKQTANKAKGSKSAGGIPEKKLEKLRRYVRARAEGFLSDPNITSVGIGYKQTKGEKTPELAIQFSVHAKAVAEALPQLGTKPIPKYLEVDGEQIPTDVIERKYEPSFKKLGLEPKNERRVRADPVLPGVSVGNLFTTAGTLGTFVRDKQTKRTVMLSNWHVMQGSQGTLGDDVVQPGKFDDNRVELNRIGKLLRSHLGPAGDCAIASITGRKFSNKIIGLGTSFSDIGEPQLDDRVVKSGRTSGVTFGVVTRLEVNTRMTYPGGQTAIIGGFEIGPDPKKPAPDNEISRGGDSGSIWMAVDLKGKPTDVMLGLHFAGDDDDGGAAEFALACLARSVMNKLEIEPIGAVKAEIATPEGTEEFRQGFDPSFLPFQIEPPKFTPSLKRDLAKLDGDEELRYCHFSVWLSKRRKYPACVAWNIDGAEFKRIKRVSFRTDRRGDLEDYQLTNDIYYDNVLDKGHIARRADLCWGSLEEAKQGNYDSFFYTNITPQHKAFNQSDDTSGDPDGGLWGRLENTVFDSEAPHKLRVSVMGGPVFSNKDKKFVQLGEDCYLPREFWKVVAYVDDEDGKEKVFAFILTQAKLIEGLVRPEALGFDEWLWARITLRDLQEKTGVVFARALKDREVAFVRAQGVGDVVMSVKPLFSKEEYFA
ncbi:DNA/RNA non-specific endonuclease [Bradyrhizobium liaoningense]|uniref:DNA/RNA non-specific endonuclease n=1 Tax=Bradyrhizobium liaoningense TaxID=43992 RepID=UPI001BACC5D7|nr:DNA/RNA non-specific endonuclease [Bradyrhizobium liaoningense]MBR1034180.1 DNA/RNA non-specific endonuclease [Bradyrhizobium liaoningense]